MLGLFYFYRVFYFITLFPLAQSAWSREHGSTGDGYVITNLRCKDEGINHLSFIPHGMDGRIRRRSCHYPLLAEGRSGRLYSLIGFVLNLRVHLPPSGSKKKRHVHLACGTCTLT